MRVLGPPVIAALAAACFADGGFQGTSSGASSTGSPSTTSTVGTGEPTTTGSDPTAGACTPRRVALEIPAPKVVLVLDKSGSMSTLLWDHDADPNTEEVNHWSVLHAAVAAISPALDGAVELGLTLFPFKGASAMDPASLCTVAPTVDVPTEPMNLADVVAAMPAADATVAGGTPTNGALKVSSAHLGGFSAATPRSVILVTDGAANCKHGIEGPQSGELFDAEGVVTVMSALASGIRTFVIGLAIPPGLTPAVPADGIPDGVDTFAALQELAVAGGTLAAYDAQTQSALEAALVDILGARLIPCEGLAAPLLADEHVAGVALSPEDGTLAFTDPCGEGAGWRFTDASQTTVTLCAASCAALQQTRVVYFDTACGA